MGQADKLEAQPESLSAQTIRLEQALAEQLRQNEHLRAQLAQSQQALAEGQSRNQALKRAKAELSQALKEQRVQNEALRRSTSWRLTSPMRAAVEAWRTFRRAVRRAAGLEPSANSVSCPPQAAAFFSEGFLAPVNLFTPAQCKLILKHYRHNARLSSSRGRKALAANDRFFYDLATRPALLALLRPLLGEDIVLWGANVVRRGPGKGHIWHTDIESSAADGRFVSVWIGLENTSQSSALHLISRSHQFGQVSDGQAIVFDGRLWHGSNNSGGRTRWALLLQYAAAEMPIAFPDLKHLDWPFRYSSDVPLKILVSGRAGRARCRLRAARPRRSQ